MSGEDLGFPIRELKESIKRYTDAKSKADAYQKRLYEEAENLFLYFVKYAKTEHTEKPTSFPTIIDNFYLDILGMPCDSQDKSIRASLTRRFKKMMKKHIIDDPKYQAKLDTFMP
jgi:hypothetical protein